MTIPRSIKNDIYWEEIKKVCNITLILINEYDYSINNSIPFLNDKKILLFDINNKVLTTAITKKYIRIPQITNSMNDRDILLHKVNALIKYINER